MRLLRPRPVAEAERGVPQRALKPLRQVHGVVPVISIRVSPVSVPELMASARVEMVSAVTVPEKEPAVAPLIAPA